MGTEGAWLLAGWQAAGVARAAMWEGPRGFGNQGSLGHLNGLESLLGKDEKFQSARAAGCTEMG